jgi:hypothetical protein
MRRIKNVRELRESIKRGNTDFRVCLNGGVYSRKTIYLSDDGTFSMFNGIDGSMRGYTGKQLRYETIVGRAMRAGAFLAEDE